MPIGVLTTSQVNTLMPNRISEEEQEQTAALWAEYKTNPTEPLRRVLIEKYTPLVHKIAKGFIYKKPHVLDYDDLFQAGRMGLLDAIEKFNPLNDKKAQFQTYATFRIRGSILDEINSMDWTPRSVRQNIKEVLRSIEKHYTEQGVEPSVDDIAKQVNLDVETTKIILGQINKTYVVQIENEVIDLVGPTTNHDQSQLESDIDIAMRKVLTDVERDYISMKYFMGYNNKEIQETLMLKAAELKSIRESAIAKLTKELETPFF